MHEHESHRPLRAQLHTQLNDTRHTKIQPPQHQFPSMSLETQALHTSRLRLSLAMPRKQRWHDKTMTVTGSGAGAGTSTVTRSDGYTDATTAARDFLGPQGCYPLITPPPSQGSRTPPAPGSPAAAPGPPPAAAALHPAARSPAAALDSQITDLPKSEFWGPSGLPRSQRRPSKLQ